VGRDERTINQSTHESLVHRPIAISIETKLERKSVDGRCQLGVWSAAWFDRMRRLSYIRPTSPTTNDKNPYTPIELPLLRSSGHYWYLLFARDCSEEGTLLSRFEILTELAVGDTISLTGLYKLLKTLRLLVDWSGGVFTRWLEREILAG